MAVGDLMRRRDEEDGEMGGVMQAEGEGGGACAASGGSGRGAWRGKERYG